MSTYESLKNHFENIFLSNIIKFLKNSGSGPDTTIDEWMRIVSHMHDKGWLYYTKQNGQIVTILGAYRIKEFDKDKIDLMPEKEEGNILFVNFAASTADHKNTLRNMTKKYLRNNPNVEEIIYYSGNQDKELTRLKIKGADNVQEKTKSTERTGVPSGAGSAT